MNKTQIEWALNPDGTPGYTWNPITGCLNGCDYCYARKLANTRLRTLYLANKIMAPLPNQYLNTCDLYPHEDPFYPRSWFDRREPALEGKKPKGIFVCDMSDLFGIGIPREWTQHIINLIRLSPQHRFYLLTKQPQNLIKFSPFPDNCWVGVTVTANGDMTRALTHLALIEAKVKYLSIEPLLGQIGMNDQMSLKYAGIKWVIIGAKTKPTVMPKIEWVREIVEACDKAGIPVFLKGNLEPLWTLENRAEPFFKFSRPSPGATEMGYLRQEMPKIDGAGRLLVARLAS